MDLGYDTSFEWFVFHSGFLDLTLMCIDCTPLPTDCKFKTTRNYIALYMNISNSLCNEPLLCIKEACKSCKYDF